ncbi:uncharacterized protein B0H18DRAFT_1007311, partial [Fomitopsis serialis]|uniref:uncharacterized protein n=1 Tax=Fomitopsis serialis TaxID=139415 RepID=UPI002007E99F
MYFSNTLDKAASSITADGACASSGFMNFSKPWTEPLPSPAARSYSSLSGLLVTNPLLHRHPATHSDPSHLELQAWCYGATRRLLQFPRRPGRIPVYTG